ncbi:MAG: threonine synthase [bacterium]
MSAEWLNPRFVAARCVTCAREWPPPDFPFTCPYCGPLMGTMDIIYDFRKLRAELPSGPFARDLWEWKDFLPVEPPESVRILPVGATPLISSDELAAKVGVKQLWLKDDRLNPSASLKDRASALALAHAIHVNAAVIAAASTGNAASSLATLAAACKMRVVLFVPEAAPEAKLAQLLLHGAHVLRIQGTYDDAFDLCAEVCRKRGWYSRNTATNPMLAEGKKTVVLESISQLEGEVPDVVMVPVGDGCILAGAHKAFLDLKDAGFVRKIPRLFGVQASGASLLVEASKKTNPFPVKASVSTFADSIRVGLPRDQVKALRAIRDASGEWVAVSDDAIRSAMRLLAQTVGMFAEPAGAAALAGLMEARERGLIHEKETALVLVTGHGLKDVKAALSAAPVAPQAVAPTLEAVETALETEIKHNS